MNDTVTIRFNEEEKKLFLNTAKLYNCSVSSMIKRLAIEKIEDEMDLNAIKNYEKSKKDGTLKTRSINKLWSELNLDD